MKSAIYGNQLSNETQNWGNTVLEVHFLGLVLLLKVKQMIIKYRIIVQSVVDFDSEAEKIQDSTKITILLKTFTG